MIQVGLKSKVEKTKEKYVFPVLTLEARKTGKGTAARFLLNQAAVNELDLEVNNTLTFGIEENVLIIINSTNLNNITDKRLFRKNYSFSNKDDYNYVVNHFNLDSTKNNEFHLICREEEIPEEESDIRIKVGVLNFITPEYLESMNKVDATEEVNEEVIVVNENPTEELVEEATSYTDLLFEDKVEEDIVTPNTENNSVESDIETF